MTNPVVWGPLPPPPGSDRNARLAPVGSVNLMFSHPKRSKGAAANRFTARSLSAWSPLRLTGSDSDAPADPLSVSNVTDEQILQKLQVERRHIRLSNRGRRHWADVTGGRRKQTAGNRAQLGRTHGDRRECGIRVYEGRQVAPRVFDDGRCE